MSTILDRVGDIEREIAQIRALEKPTKADLQRLALLGTEALVLLRETCKLWAEQEAKLAEYGEVATERATKRTMAEDLLNDLVLKYAGTGEIHRDLVTALSRLKGDRGESAFPVGTPAGGPGPIPWTGTGPRRHPGRSGGGRFPGSG